MNPAADMQRKQTAETCGVSMHRAPRHTGNRSARRQPTAGTRVAIGHLLFCLSLLFALLPIQLHAVTTPPATFQALPALAFNKAYAGGDPLPQVITASSTAGSFQFSSVTATSSGGDWLSVSPSGCCAYTPTTITVSAKPDVALASGSYDGQITLKSTDGTQTLVIPVSLTIAPASATFFDSAAGALTFSMKTVGTAPPAQTLPIRNGGSGTLDFTASAATADGGHWLTLSATSGTAPTALTVAVDPSKLPGSGLVAGTFVGQVLLHTAGDTVSVPVTFTVNTMSFEQLNPLFFNKTFEGADPTPQVVTVASAGSSFQFASVAVTSTGGNWLTISPVGCCAYTPFAVTVSGNPEITLAAGTYTAEIIFRSTDGTQSSVVPVSLLIAPPSATFFDQLAGELTFSLATKGNPPPVQTLSIRNAGAGELDWTAATSTADGGSWLTLSAKSGAAPSTLDVGVDPTKLPGAGLVAGTFVAQVVLQTAGDSVTIPVTVTVGTSVFRQLNALSFTKTLEGGDPAPQVITLASTGAAFQFASVAVNSTGGSWLSISPSGCCAYTPFAVTVSAHPDITLAAGTYTAEIIFRSTDGTQSSVVPVSLTIASPSATFFDALAGELTFSLVTKGNAPPAQTLLIRNAGKATLNWTASASTADGGNWLSLSAQNGTAPSTLDVAIDPASLPGAGLVGGTFVGQVVLRTSGDTVTVPVTVTVAAAAFRQLNALAFSKKYAGGDPLPQLITVASTGASFQFSSVSVSSTGGDWLSISPSGCCAYTPRTVTVSANPDITLAPGTYLAQITFRSTDGTQASVIPVTLTVEAPSAAFFDSVVGGLTFSMLTGDTPPPSLPIQVNNAGKGTLNFMASATTADGGSWLTLGTQSGTAPATLGISVDPSALPGFGLVPGTFVGQVVLMTQGDRVTVPVTFTVGSSVFQPLSPLVFNKAVNGSNPAVQTITVASTGTDFQFASAAVNSTGGSWLSISPVGCCAYTPKTVNVTATPAVTLAAGTYIAEIIFGSTDGTQASVIPVTLTIGGGTQPTASPIVSPGTGSYTAAQSVTLTDTTAAATIYYTTDGSAPTTSSPQYTGAITVSANQTLRAAAIATGDTLSTPVSATYTFVSATATPAVLSFGSQATGSNSTSQTITIANPGANTLPAFSISLSGTNAADFAFVVSNCDQTIPAGGSCSVSVTFSPHASGSRTATLGITYTGIGSPLTVALGGAGTAATTSLSLTPSLTAPIYGQALSLTAALTGNPAPTGSLNFTLDASAKQTASLTAGSATLNFGVLAAGSHTLTATYAGDSLYAAATRTLTFDVAQAVLTASAANLSRTYAAANPALTYTVTGFVNGDTAAILAGSTTLSTTATASSSVGTYPITFATQGLSAANYTVTYKGATLTVNPATQAITFSAIANQVFGGSLTLAATASSGLPVTYTVAGPASLSGATLTFTGTGSVSITALQSGNGNYTAATPVTQSIAVAAATQTITFTGLPTSATFGAAGPYTLNATDSSGLPITYAVSGPASLSSNILTITGTGSVAVTASQTGSTNYTAAAPVTQTIIVAASSQTITFTGLPSNATFGSAGPYALNAKASSALPVTYIVSGPATLAGSTLTLTGAGSVTVTASQPGNSLFSAAASVTQTILVAQAAQTITFTGLPANATFGSAGPYTLNAKATSALPITYSVSGPAALAGSTLTLTGTGSVAVTASQSGNTNYTAAAPVTQTIVIAASTQTITFTGLPTNATFGSAGPYTLNAAASSGLPVTYTASGPATLAGSILTITGAGSVTVTASQAGNSLVSAATPITQTIHVGRAAQTITFTGLPATATFGSAGPYTLNAAASSGLPITYIISGPATLSGSTLTLTGAGTLSVAASQPGNANYTAATSVTQTILVNAPATGPAQLLASALITRRSDGSYQVTVTVTNNGGDRAQNVVLTSFLFGATAGTPTPQPLNTIAAGAQAVATFSLPSSAGASGTHAVEKIGGTHLGGTFGSSFRSTLP